LRTQERMTYWRRDTIGRAMKEIPKGRVTQSPACTPEGQWVAYQAPNDAGSSIWKVPIDGGPAVKLSAELMGAAPAVSPDGKMVAFNSLKTTGPNLQPLWVVVPSDGGAPLYTLN